MNFLWGAEEKSPIMVSLWFVDHPPGTVPEGERLRNITWRMLGSRRSIIARDFQSCLAKTVEQVLDEFGIPPFPEFLARNDGEVRSHRQELPDGIAFCIPFAELRVRCGKREVRAPKGGHC